MKIFAGYKYHCLFFCSEDLRLCTKDQVRDIAETTSICISGWWVTAKDENNAIAGADRGWYVGELFASNCGGIAGERTWQPSDGKGAAHCCVPCNIQKQVQI